MLQSTFYLSLSGARPSRPLSGPCVRRAAYASCFVLLRILTIRPTSVDPVPRPRLRLPLAVTALAHQPRPCPLAVGKVVGPGGVRRAVLVRPSLLQVVLAPSPHVPVPLGRQAPRQPQAREVASVPGRETRPASLVTPATVPVTFPMGQVVLPLGPATRPVSPAGVPPRRPPGLAGVGAAPPPLAGRVVVAKPVVPIPSPV